MPGTLVSGFHVLSAKGAARLACGQRRRTHTLLAPVFPGHLSTARLASLRGAPSPILVLPALAFLPPIATRAVHVPAFNTAEIYVKELCTALVSPPVRRIITGAFVACP